MLFKEHNGILADFSRQRFTKDTLAKLLKLAEGAKLKEKIEEMFTGEHINITEDRAVLHVALRAARDQVSFVLILVLVCTAWISNSFSYYSNQRFTLQTGRRLELQSTPYHSFLASFQGPCQHKKADTAACGQ